MLPGSCKEFCKTVRRSLPRGSESPGSCHKKSHSCYCQALFSKEVTWLLPRTAEQNWWLRRDIGRIAQKPQGHFQKKGWQFSSRAGNTPYKKTLRKGSRGQLILKEASEERQKQKTLERAKSWNLLAEKMTLRKMSGKEQKEGARVLRRHLKQWVFSFTKN